MLAQTLPRMNRLVELDLSQNGICDQGAAALADALLELSIAKEQELDSLSPEPLPKVSGLGEVGKGRVVGWAGSRFPRLGGWVR